jgi:hypothetical protein
MLITKEDELLSSSNLQRIHFIALYSQLILSSLWTIFECPYFMLLNISRVLIEGKAERS